MYEIITQDRFRKLIMDYIHKTVDMALYSMDVISPLLEKMRFEEAQILMSGYGGLISTLDVLSSNIDIVVKDRLVNEKNDMVYYLNEAGLPSKMSKDAFDRMVKTLRGEGEKEYETGYLQSPVDKDENMFV